MLYFPKPHEAFIAVLITAGGCAWLWHEYPFVAEGLLWCFKATFWLLHIIGQIAAAHS